MHVTTHIHSRYAAQQNIMLTFSHIQFHDAPNADNITDMAYKCLTTTTAQSSSDVSRKLVCLGADGASVMAGVRNGVTTQFINKHAPFAQPMHCMPHCTNLAAGKLDETPIISHVRLLAHQVSNFLCHSPKWCRALAAAAEEVGTNGNKILRDIQTRWISLQKLAERIWDEFKALVLFFSREVEDEVVGAKYIMDLLLDLETQLSLTVVMPMLEQLDMLTKFLQCREVFLHDMVEAIQLVTQQLRDMYISPTTWFNEGQF
jgi:hypothetical protein